MSNPQPDPYRAVARWYDILIEPLNRKLKGMMLRFVPPERGEVVLDVGCGTGVLLERYLDAGCEVWGLDMSSAMLAQARRRLGARAELHEGDARAMPFPDDRFDWVAFSFVLHEMVPDMRLAVLAEARRVVRPAGHIVAIDYHDEPQGTARGWLLKASTIAIERVAGGDHWASYRHYMAHGAVVGLADQADLELVRQRVVGHGNLAITVLRRPASP